jgi:hypothetical protein
MNILEIEDTLKGIPDEALIQEAQSPSGGAPQYLVISEIQRRSDMRERFAAEQQQPQNTVSDQIVNKGIMTLGGSSAPPPVMDVQQPMSAAPPMAPPMAEQAMPAQPMAPPQMMSVGGEVVLDEEDDVTMLLDELSSSMNKIPDNRERDLFISDFASSVLSDVDPQPQGPVSNALREDASKFNPAQMMGADIDEISAFQSAGSDLPEILNYAGGGIVELQDGGEVPEEEKGSYFSGDQGFVPDWVEENPWKTALGAADAVALGLMFAPEPIVSKAAAGILKAGTTAARFIPRLFGARRLSNLPRAEQVARLGRHGYAGRAERLRAGTAVDRAARARAIARAQARLGLRGTAGLGILGATNYGTFFGDDDPNAAEGQMPEIDPDVYREYDYGGYGNGILGAGEEGPEIGSIGFVQQELARRYESGGTERQEKLDEILGRQREESDLMKEQARSDMVTSALMNLGAGIAAGDPSEGLRLAANAVDGIRSAARQGIVEQQKYMDELELAGIDSNNAEEAATLAAMADAERLKQSGLQLNNQAVTNAFRAIDQAVEALAARSMQTGNVIKQVDIYDRTARAYQLALQDPTNTQAYMSALMQPSDSDNNFDISED